MRLRHPEHQLTAHLTAPERNAFEAYARQFLLDPAALLALLFSREMRVGRLRELMRKDAAPDASRDTKITVRVKAAEHAAVTKVALEHCDSVSQAGAILVRDELRERWLEQVTTRFESPDVVGSPDELAGGRR